MKITRLISLLIIATITLTGCPDGLQNCDDSKHFLLSLNFQDASGKDLVEGIGYIPGSGPTPSDISGWVEKGLYALIMIKNTRNEYVPDPPQLLYSQESSGYCLTFHKGGFSPGTINTYLFSCPYIFGDDARHEIVAYCKERKNHYECYRLTLDGKDIEPFVNSGTGDTSATIILDYIKPDE